MSKSASEASRKILIKMHIFVPISLMRVHFEHWKFYLAKLLEGHVPPVPPGSYAHVISDPSSNEVYKNLEI